MGGHFCVTITTNWNWMTISDNYTTIVAQIKIWRETTLRGCHVRSDAGIHVPIRIRRSECVHSGLDFSWSKLHVCRVGLRWTWPKYASLPRFSRSPGLRSYRIWTRRDRPRHQWLLSLLSNPYPRLPLLLLVWMLLSAAVPSTVLASAVMVATAPAAIASAAVCSTFVFAVLRLLTTNMMMVSVVMSIRWVIIVFLSKHGNVGSYSMLFCRVCFLKDKHGMD